MSMSDSDFKLWESSVAVSLGISRDEIRRLREAHLVEGTHFRKKNRRICLSEAGAQLLQARLQATPSSPTAPEAPPPSLDAARAEKDAPRDVQQLPGAIRLPAQAEPDVFWLAKKLAHNPRMLIGHFPGTDPSLNANQVRIRVKNSANFIFKRPDGAPFEIPARKVQGDLYDLARPCPRYPGVW